MPPFCYTYATLVPPAQYPYATMYPHPTVRTTRRLRSSLHFPRATAMLLVCYPRSTSIPPLCHHFATRVPPLYRPFTILALPTLCYHATHDGRYHHLGMRIEQLCGHVDEAGLPFEGVDGHSAGDCRTSYILHGKELGCELACIPYNAQDSAPLRSRPSTPFP